MGVNEDDVMNIMGGMEHAGGIKLNDHKRKLKNRYSFYFIQVHISVPLGQLFQQRLFKYCNSSLSNDYLKISHADFSINEVKKSVAHPYLLQGP